MEQININNYVLYLTSRWPEESIKKLKLVLAKKKTTISSGYTKVITKD